MVKVSYLPDSIEVELTPNRSLSWRQTRLVMLVFGGFCLSIAFAWFFVGAWLILPFAGIEVGLLAFIMYLVSKSSYQKQLLVFTESEICFVYGRQQNLQKRYFSRSQVKLITYEVRHPEDVKELYLAQHRHFDRVGEFLNLEDQALLLQHFKEQSIYPQEIKHSIEFQC